MPVISESAPPSSSLPKPKLPGRSGPGRRRVSRLRMLLPLLLAGLVAFDAEAARQRRRTVRYRTRPVPHRRVQPPRPAPPPAETRPKDKLVAFRDLAEGAEFFHPADRDRKLRPLRKISATHAQPLAVTASDSAELVAIPGELKVIVKPSSGANAGVKKKKSRSR
jgi:hypothetical protein